MRIRKIAIKNVRAFADVELALPSAKPGWYVVLGDNSTGKSTLIRAIALAFTGPKDALGLRQSWGEWLRHGTSELSIELDLDFDPRVDEWSGSGAHPKTHFLIGFGHEESAQYPKGKGKHGKRTVWGDKSGWFSSAFGPFRRFTGGSREHDRTFLAIPRLARHLTAFGEDVALTECLDWLATLERSSDDGEQALFNDLRDFINGSEFLPQSMRFDALEGDSPIFVDATGVRLPVEQLSDGFRSTLSLAFELIRQLVQVYKGHDIFKRNEDGIYVALPGVVLIDEVDVHLHPSWQASIGAWFKRFFPEVQFIVTTHSPLICRPADAVWRLHPKDGAIRAEPITGTDLDRLRYGTVDDALDSSAFGLGGISRSDKANALLDELAALNREERRGRLSVEDRQRLKALRRIFVTEADR